MEIPYSEKDAERRLFLFAGLFDRRHRLSFAVSSC